MTARTRTSLAQRFRPGSQAKRRSDLDDPGDQGGARAEGAGEGGEEERVERVEKAQEVPPAPFMARRPILGSGRQRRARGSRRWRSS